MPQKSNDAFTAATSLSLPSVSFSFLDLRLGNVANLGAKEIVGFGDVRREMAERHLVRRGLEAKFVGRHFFDGRDGILLTAGQRVAQDVGHRILGLLSESGDGQQEYG